jgi:hypothetical protein
MSVAALAVGTIADLPDVAAIIERVAGALGPWTYVIVAVLVFLETVALAGLLSPGEATLVVGRSANCLRLTALSAANSGGRANCPGFVPVFGSNPGQFVRGRASGRRVRGNHGTLLPLIAPAARCRKRRADESSLQPTPAAHSGQSSGAHSA